MSVAKTAMLLAALTVVFMTAGYLLGGGAGALIALVFAGATNAFAFWNSDKMALRMHNAQVITQASHPELVGMVARLAEKADMPMPGVYLIDTEQPNAFATGRNPENGAVAVTRGLLQVLNAEEVEAVIAHELAHIQNRDTLIMTIAATFAGAISFLANIGFLFGGNRDRGQFGILGVLIAVILAPLAAALIQMSISRTREYGADRGAAEITGKPLALASALARISGKARSVMMPSAETHQNTAHMFIINPLVGMRLDRLFGTHPPAELRIAALEQMATDGQYHAPKQTRLTRRSSIPTVRRRR